MKFLKFTLKIALFCAFAFALFLILDALYPLNLDMLNKQKSRILYDRNGEILNMQISDDQIWRFYASADEIPPRLKQSAIYFEDRYFYYHFGVNPASILRAATYNFTQNFTKKSEGNVERVGASTITMQVARMMRPKQRSYKNKIIEIFNAFQLEWHFSKDEILGMYFNLAPYGGNIEGVKTAAYFYFKKDLRELSNAQIALLSVIPKNPNKNRLDRRSNINALKNRLISQLREGGVISQSEYERALAEPFSPRRYAAPNYAPHYAILAFNNFANARNLRGFARANSAQDAAFCGSDALGTGCEGRADLNLSSPAASSKSCLQADLTLNKGFGGATKLNVPQHEKDGARAGLNFAEQAELNSCSRALNSNSQADQSQSDAADLSARLQDRSGGEQARIGAQTSCDLNFNSQASINSRSKMDLDLAGLNSRSKAESGSSLQTGSNFARKSHFENFKILDLGAQAGQARSSAAPKERAAQDEDARGKEQGVSNKNLQNKPRKEQDTQSVYPSARLGATNPPSNLSADANLDKKQGVASVSHAPQNPQTKASSSERPSVNFNAQTNSASGARSQTNSSSSAKAQINSNPNAKTQENFKNFKGGAQSKEQTARAQELARLSEGKIYSNLDLKTQIALENFLKDEILELRRKGVRNGAAVLIDNESMSVIAYVGSHDFSGREGQNDGVRSQKNVGSTLKPFIYAKALEHGLITPSKKLIDAPIIFAGYVPRNYNQGFMGAVSATDALSLSLNIPAVKLNLMLEGDGLYEMLSNVHLAEFSKDYYGAGIALGSISMSLMDLARLYSAFANGGKLRKLEIAGAKTGDEMQILTPQSVYIVTQMLRNAPRSYLGSVWQNTLNAPPLMFKTGTTADARDLYTVALTPKFTLGVWLGNFDGSKTKDISGGVSAAKVAFNMFAFLDKSAMLGETEFARPHGVSLQSVCADAYREEGCAQSANDLTIEGVELNEECEIYGTNELFYLLKHGLIDPQKARTGRCATKFAAVKPTLNDINAKTYETGSGGTLRLKVQCTAVFGRNVYLKISGGNEEFIALSPLTSKSASPGRATERSFKISNLAALNSFILNFAPQNFDVGVERSGTNARRLALQNFNPSGEQIGASKTDIARFYFQNFDAADRRFAADKTGALDLINFGACSMRIEASKTDASGSCFQNFDAAGGLRMQAGGAQIGKGSVGPLRYATQILNPSGSRIRNYGMGAARFCFQNFNGRGVAADAANFNLGATNYILDAKNFAPCGANFTPPPSGAVRTKNGAAQINTNDTVRTAAALTQIKGDVAQIGQIENTSRIMDDAAQTKTDATRAESDATPIKAGALQTESTAAQIQTDTSKSEGGTVQVRTGEYFVRANDEPFALSLGAGEYEIGCLDENANFIKANFVVNQRK